VLQRERAAIGLAGDIDKRRGVAVTGNDLKLVLRAILDGAELGDAHEPVSRLSHHDTADGLGRVRQARYHDAVLAVVPIYASGRRRLVRVLDRLGDLIEAYPVRQKTGRIELNADLAHEAALYLDGA